MEPEWAPPRLTALDKCTRGQAGAGRAWQVWGALLHTHPWQAARPVSAATILGPVFLPLNPTSPVWYLGLQQLKNVGADLSSLSSPRLPLTVVSDSRGPCPAARRNHSPGLSGFTAGQGEQAAPRLPPGVTRSLLSRPFLRMPWLGILIIHYHFLEEEESFGITN